MARQQTAGDYHHGDLRAALMIAGEAELAERGVEGFSLRGAAARAGVSHAAPAHHFGDADGLLTALAAEGYVRFAAAMRARQTALTGEDPGEGQARCKGDGRELINGAGLGYLDFARAYPALFRLMFASRRPDFTNAVLQAAATAAFGVLAQAVGTARGADPWTDPTGPVDVAAAWALAHGLADLLLSDRLWFLQGAMEADSDRTVLAVMERLVLQAPGAGFKDSGGS